MGSGALPGDPATLQKWAGDATQIANHLTPVGQSLSGASPGTMGSDPSSSWHGAGVHITGIAGHWTGTASQNYDQMLHQIIDAIQEIVKTLESLAQNLNNIASAITKSRSFWNTIFGKILAIFIAIVVVVVTTVISMFCPPLFAADPEVDAVAVGASVGTDTALDTVGITSDVADMGLDDLFDEGLTSDMDDLGLDSVFGDGSLTSDMGDLDLGDMFDLPSETPLTDDADDLDLGDLFGEEDPAAEAEDPLEDLQQSLGQWFKGKLPGWADDAVWQTGGSLVNDRITVAEQGGNIFTSWSPDDAADILGGVFADPAGAIGIHLLEKGVLELGSSMGKLGGIAGQMGDGLLHGLEKVTPEEGVPGWMLKGLTTDNLQSLFKDMLKGGEIPTGIDAGLSSAFGLLAGPLLKAVGLKQLKAALIKAGVPAEKAGEKADQLIDGILDQISDGISRDLPPWAEPADPPDVDPAPAPVIPHDLLSPPPLPA